MPDWPSILATARPAPPTDAGTPTDRLVIDGYGMRIARQRHQRTLFQEQDGVCSWGPNNPYLSTAVSTVLMNGRVFREAVYRGYMERGTYGDQGFAFYTPDDPLEHPDVPAFIEAWQAHHGRPFDDRVVVCSPSWRAPDGIVAMRTLQKVVGFGVWLYHQSEPGPWLFRKDPLSGTASLVPGKEERIALDPVEAALRAGRAADLAPLGLNTTEHAEYKLLHLAALRCWHLHEAYWRWLAAKAPQEVADRSPLYPDRPYMGIQGVRDALTSDHIWWLGTGLLNRGLAPEKLAALASMGLHDLRDRYAAGLAYAEAVPLPPTTYDLTNLGLRGDVLLDPTLSIGSKRDMAMRASEPGTFEIEVAGERRKVVVAVERMWDEYQEKIEVLCARLEA